MKQHYLQVTVTSTSLPHTGGAEKELSADISLPGVKDVVIARTFVTICKRRSLPFTSSWSLLLLSNVAGSILCAVGLKRGQVKVFSLTASLCWSNEFTLSVILATECHQMSSVSSGDLGSAVHWDSSVPFVVLFYTCLILTDKITSLLMLPHPDGCTVHVCHNGTSPPLSLSLSPPPPPLSSSLPPLPPSLTPSLTPLSSSLFPFPLLTPFSPFSLIRHLALPVVGQGHDTLWFLHITTWTDTHILQIDIQHGRLRPLSWITWSLGNGEQDEWTLTGRGHQRRRWQVAGGSSGCRGDGWKCRCSQQRFVQQTSLCQTGAHRREHGHWTAWWVGVLVDLRVCSGKQHCHDSLMKLSALKRRRVDQAFDEGGKYLVSLSPSACCLAVGNGNSISFYQIGKVILGLKGMLTLIKITGMKKKEMVSNYPNIPSYLQTQPPPRYRVVAGFSPWRLSAISLPGIWWSHAAASN